VKVLAALSVAAVAGGVVLIVADTEIPGILLLLAGLAIGALLGGLSLVLSARREFREWFALVSGGVPSAINVVSVTPPQGAIVKRDATITVEVTAQDGSVRRADREMSIPIPQAIMWKLAGRVPLPLARFARMGEVDLASYSKRAADS
jgi:hypothetical protein